MDMAPVSTLPCGTPHDVFHQIGQLTRQLHDSLSRLGALQDNLQASAVGLPDARSRLHYIARKSGEAADKVLNAVELAKHESASLALQARRHEGTPLAGEVEAALQRIDAQLTDIMMAQDYHDLTGQVVSKVVTLAADLEDSLVKLLVRVAPAEPRKPDPALLSGPAVDGVDNGNVVNNQEEVDALLANLGF
jgi:chemotaxis protein CheZ